MTPESSPEDTAIYGIEDDPVLGKYVSHYPGERLRLLIIGGGILAVVWFVTTVVLWSIEDEGLAATITVVIMAVATLLVGWYVAHLWNREVILYVGGFSYREGSQLAYLQYSEIRDFRQRAERVSYFGGAIKRTIYEINLTTAAGEQIKIGNFYKHVDEMGVQLESRITDAQLERAQAMLRNGELIPFTDHLSVSIDGIHADSLMLPWADAAPPQIKNRQVIISTRGGDDWCRAPLKDLPNARLLLALFREYTVQENPTS